jgi:hypothetical protein
LHISVKHVFDAKIEMPKYQNSKIGNPKSKIQMWLAKTKQDLIIEVWEKLDCQSVGAAEIRAIEKVVNDVYGASAVESPMIIARRLADEGAELRHAEIMELNIKRSQQSPYAPMFRNILKYSDFRQTVISIRRLENLRQKFLRENDREGLRLVRETGIKGKTRALMIAQNPQTSPQSRVQKSEIAQWFKIWLQSPEIFENWIEVRQKSPDFVDKFETD